MVRLINIKRNDGFIEAEYIPEHANETGYVKINTATMEVVERRLTSIDGAITKSYMRHATYALKELIDCANLPETKLVMWY